MKSLIASSVIKGLNQVYSYIISYKYRKMTINSSTLPTCMI